MKLTTAIASWLAQIAERKTTEKRSRPLLVSKKALNEIAVLIADVIKKIQDK